MIPQRVKGSAKTDYITRACVQLHAYTTHVQIQLHVLTIVTPPPYTTKS